VARSQLRETETEPCACGARGHGVGRWLAGSVGWTVGSR
jgi:hypothetical protein